MKKFKKLAVALFMVLAMIAPMTLPVSGTYAIAEAAAVSLSKKSLKLDIGQTAALKVSGTKSKVTWKSSDKEIATVTSKGVVLGYSAGNATITATVNKKKYTCKVTVNLPSNLYQSNADWQEILIDKVSLVIPTACTYETTQKSESSLQTIISFEDPGQQMVVDVTYTGEAADYDSLEATLDETISEDVFADLAAEDGLAIGDFKVYKLDSTVGTVYAYSFYLGDDSRAIFQVIYEYSIDNYNIKLMSLDATDSDLFDIAEWTLSSTMQYE